MKARGGRFLLILGAGLAAMAFVVVYLVMSRSSTPAVDQAASVPVTVPMKAIVVAKVPIAAYTTLDETNLALLEVEASTVSTDAVTDPSTLYKKMSTTAVAAQGRILASQVTSVSFSNALAKGEKAFSLPVTARNTFGDSLSEGDHVDVLWSIGQKIKVPYRSEDGKIVYDQEIYTTTKTLLQDVRVIRVISLRVAIIPPTQPNGGGGDGAGDAQKAAAANQQLQQSLSSLYADGAPYSAVLLLAINDQQAEVLNYALGSTGTIDLTLRSSAALKKADGTLEKDAAGNEIKGDHEAEKTTGITIRDLVKAYGLTDRPAEWGPAPTP